jgi:hypothetical protein
MERDALYIPNRNFESLRPVLAQWQRITQAYCRLPGVDVPYW